jgi:hypothetical protein
MVVENWNVKTTPSSAQANTPPASGGQHGGKRELGNRLIFTVYINFFSHPVSISVGGIKEGGLLLNKLVVFTLSMKTPKSSCIIRF